MQGLVGGAFSLAAWVLGVAALMLGAAAQLATIVLLLVGLVLWETAQRLRHHP